MHLFRKKRLFGPKRSGATPPRQFGRTVAIMVVTLALVALGIGFELAMEALTANMDRYQYLQMQYGPIFHGAMKQEAYELTERMDCQVLFISSCLTLMFFLLMYDCVLITRRILTRAAWRPATL